jgi:putative copper resistance protein D
MSYALAGSVSALLATSYGNALILKVVYVAGLLALAAGNKMRFVPRMRRGDHAASANLTAAIKVEWVLFIAIFATTAVLTSTLTLPG